MATTKLTVPILVDWESIKDYLAMSDIVEVVRCKDCKFYEFWEHKGIYLCERWSGDPYEAAQPGDDDFCSWAERSER